MDNLKQVTKLNEYLLDPITTIENEKTNMQSVTIIGKLSENLLPKRSDVVHFNIKISPGEFNSIIDIQAKQIVIPLLYDNYIEQLKLKFTRVLPILLLNQYKFLMLNDIYTKLNIPCNITVKSLELAICSEIDVCDGPSFYKFSKTLKRAPTLIDIYTLMDGLPINVLLFNKFESVFYKKNEIYKPLLVFRYYSKEEINYVGYYDSLYLFSTYIFNHLPK